MFGSWMVAVGEGLRSGGLGGGAAGPSLGPTSVLSLLPVCGAAMRSQPWLQYCACRSAAIPLAMVMMMTNSNSLELGAPNNPFGLGHAVVTSQ